MVRGRWVVWGRRVEAGCGEGQVGGVGQEGGGRLWCGAGGWRQAVVRGRCGVGQEGGGRLW